tara:strand:- start:156 stop:434 length:279 start_codon:yes stop_codon:yes gene_type:complete
MNILESYYISESETLLVDNKNISYLVNYNVIKELKEGLGYVDYDTPFDSDETTTEIEMIECFICNEDLENTANVSEKDLETIKDYLLTINQH